MKADSGAKGQREVGGGKGGSVGLRRGLYVESETEWGREKLFIFLHVVMLSVHAQRLPSAITRREKSAGSGGTTASTSASFYS